MKILFLSFYFEPDLSAGSFRNTSLLKEISKSIASSDTIKVLTTQPNRYNSFNISVNSEEKLQENISLTRIKVPRHKGGFFNQIKSYYVFYKKVLKISKNEDFDYVYASSSKLFTAYLGAKIAKKNKTKLYLDIRDIFVESIQDVFKNKFFKFALAVALKPIEKFTFNNATHINLVSKGFKSYFKNYKKPSYSYYTNGIDDIFIDKKNVEVKPNKRSEKSVIYAGNIGEGQGLDIILPKLAKAFEGELNFLIYGDGGAKHKLVEKIEQLELTNISLNDPINRKDLILEYSKADYLFMHLNTFKAFERVLPSKLFEYATFNKPIIAGVGGFAATFLKDNISNLILFEPGNFNQAISRIKNHDYKFTERSEFINKYSRKHINLQMVESILSVYNS